MAAKAGFLSLCRGGCGNFDCISQMLSFSSLMMLSTKNRHNNWKCELAREIPVGKTRNEVFPCYTFILQ